MKITIVGAGHVGFPFGVFLTNFGHEIAFVESNVDHAVKISTATTMPYDEPKFVVNPNAYSVHYNFRDVPFASDVVFICVPTPVVNGEPNLGMVIDAVREVMLECETWAPDFHPTLAIRSTIPLGTEVLLKKMAKNLHFTGPIVATPERIAEGHAYEELSSLPQLLGTLVGNNADIYSLFREFTTVFTMSFEEATFAKLATNAYAYAHFAIANELSMLAGTFGIDYATVSSLMKLHYPRLRSLPSQGLTAGTCLRKDWKLLTSSVYGETIFDAANSANEAYPKFCAETAVNIFDTIDFVVGLGFKPYSSDLRDSLTGIMLVEIFKTTGKMPFVLDPNFHEGIYSLTWDGQMEYVADKFHSGLGFIVVNGASLSKSDYETKTALFALPYESSYDFINSYSCW